MESPSSGLRSPRKFSYLYHDLDTFTKPSDTTLNEPSHPKHQDCKDSSVSPKYTGFGYDRLVVRYSRDFGGAEILLPSENACACLIKCASMFELCILRASKSMDID